jgi:hypothetical protein
MDNFLGKFLMRVATGNDGKKVVVICGVAKIPEGMEIDDGDEMWATKFHIDPKTARFINSNNEQFSPEDFLANAGNIQDPRLWERKK